MLLETNLFLWLMEAHEQRMFDLSPLDRSRYHPEKLLELWRRASTDDQYRQECETAGFQFNFSMKAVNLGVGWIYIGDRFVEDFLEVENTLEVELLFPNPPAKKGKPAFQDFKKRPSSRKKLTQTGVTKDSETRRR